MQKREASGITTTWIQCFHHGFWRENIYFWFRSKLFPLCEDAEEGRWMRWGPASNPLSDGQCNARCEAGGGGLIPHQRTFILPFIKRRKWLALQRCDSSWWKTTFTATLGNQTHIHTVAYQCVCVCAFVCVHRLTSIAILLFSFILCSGKATQYQSYAHRQNQQSLFFFFF